MISPTSTPPTVLSACAGSPARPFLTSVLFAAVLALGVGSGLHGQTSPATVSANAVAQSHSIEGKLLRPADAGPLEGIVVTIVETGATATVDAGGNFAFSAVAPGTYTLSAAGNGYSTLKITGVMVMASEVQNLPGKEMPVDAPGGVLTVSAKADDEKGVQKLPSFFVESAKLKSFEGGGANMDIPRTSNDVQPYTIINAEAMEESNRLNVGDFLQDQVTQSVTGLQYNQTPATYNVSSSATSQVNLRGLGNLQTLILVNGTRIPGVVFKGAESQPNVNQIPSAAIDHVEILAASASGIYGSAAVGGVINIVLKKNFTGGEFSASYQNSFVTDNPTRTLSLYDSFMVKNTRVSFVLNYSDGKPPLRQDRPFVKNNFYRAVQNAPALFYGPNAPFAAGALPNIALNTAVVNGYTNPSNTSLTLKNGVSLGSTVTYVPGGTSTTTDANTLYAGLLANAGKQNFDEANSVYRGSQEPLLNVPQNRTLMTTLNHKFNDKVEVYADISINQQKTHSSYLPLVNGNNSTTTFYFAVPGNSPTNPFLQNIFISQPLPVQASAPYVTTAVTRTFKGGVSLHLGKGWEALAEYSYSFATDEIRYGLENFNSTTVYGAEGILVFNGLYNPFVDSLKDQQNIGQYYGTWIFFNPTHLLDFNARASGPVYTLPGGSVTMTTGFEARLNIQDPNYEVGTFPVLPGTGGVQNVSTAPYNQGFQAEKQIVKALYAEFNIPLISGKNENRFAKGLELQIAGRVEDFSIITTPDQINYYPNYPDPATRVTHSGVVGRFWNKYTSVNPTYGLKYTPFNSLVLRASYAVGFVPPTYTQFGGSVSGLSTGNTASTFDPVTGKTYLVPQLLGVLSNPDLKPQVSKNWDLGMIYQPQSGPLKDLRISVDFYKLTEFNGIYQPTYSQTLSSPKLAYLVPRGPDGLVTSFTRQFLNAQKQYTDGYDLGLDYRFRTDNFGTFNLHAGGTIIEHLKIPFQLDGPLVEYSGFPNSGGAIKTKANAALSWLVGKHWTFGWNTHYWGAYKQQGSPSDPQYNGASVYTPVTTQLLPQGGVAATNGAWIPAQMYHSIFAIYAFGDAPKFHHMFSNSTIQVGVDDLFNSAPPFDANSAYAPFYYSPYGNIQLRSYLMKFKKDF